MSKLALAVLVALFVPAVAHAGDVALRMQDVPLGPRALSAARTPMHFNMLGVHWRGPGSVSYRTRSLAGTWRGWTDVDADANADLGSPERDTWRDGDLAWTGPSSSVQFRTRGKVTRLRSYYVWSRVTTRPLRRLSFAGSPAILPRSAWQADEKIKRAKPIYAPTLKLAIVHHTAGTNSYSPAQAAAIVRGIEVYHVKGNGWNDIGYNFLVDRFGNVYEGRAGGTERNVIGAHAQGFNTGSVGVALIGNYSHAAPPKAQQDALVKLLAWRLDVAHIDPLSTVVLTSGGNAKFRAGKVVTLRTISGHRDTGPSECPGALAYRLLPSIASRVSTTGLPKLYSPVVSGKLGGKVRFQARLSSAFPWTVTVTDVRGSVVAKGSGQSAIVDWTWDATRAGKGPFAWRIEAGPTVRPATGSFGKLSAPATAVPGALTLTGLAATPSVVSPAPDGSGEVATISFALGAAARVTASVADWNGGAPIPVFDRTLAAGKGSFDVVVGTLPDGRYTLLVTARAGAKAISQQLELVVDRTLGGLLATPGAISPNGDGVSDASTVGFSLAQAVPVRVEIRSGVAVVASLFAGTLGPGVYAFPWDGTSAGARVPDGAFDAVVTVTDALGDVARSARVVVDTVPPVLSLLDAASLRFQLSEPATVSLTVNGQPLVLPAPSGVFTAPWSSGAVTSVSAQARDAAGNASPVVTGP
jgi:hypothetical protein